MIVVVKFPDSRLGYHAQPSVIALSKMFLDPEIVNLATLPTGSRGQDMLLSYNVQPNGQAVRVTCTIKCLGKYIWNLSYPAERKREISINPTHHRYRFLLPT